MVLDILMLACHKRAGSFVAPGSLSEPLNFLLLFLLPTHALCLGEGLPSATASAVCGKSLHPGGWGDYLGSASRWGLWVGPSQCFRVPTPLVTLGGWGQSRGC